MVRVVEALARALLAVAFILALEVATSSVAGAQSITQGDICGGPGALSGDMLGKDLAKRLDEPELRNFSSIVIVLTECYGGDTFSDLLEHMSAVPGRTVTILSATSAGQQARYGGYDDDAIRAIKPGATTDAIHQAGVTGKDSSETPIKTGPNTTIGGGAGGTYVVFYAGRPDARDGAMRDSLAGNFAGKPGYSFMCFGGARRSPGSRLGEDGWEYSADFANWYHWLWLVSPRP